MQVFIGSALYCRDILVKSWDLNEEIIEKEAARLCSCRPRRLSVLVQMNCQLFI